MVEGLLLSEMLSSPAKKNLISAYVSVSQKNLRLASAMAVDLSVAVTFVAWLPQKLDVSVVVEVSVHVVWVAVDVSVQQDVVPVEVEF